MIYKLKGTQTYQGMLRRRVFIFLLQNNEYLTQFLLHF
jgi:hypothetical protein